MTQCSHRQSGSPLSLHKKRFLPLVVRLDCNFMLSQRYAASSAHQNEMFNFEGALRNEVRFPVDISSSFFLPSLFFHFFCLLCSGIRRMVQYVSDKNDREKFFPSHPRRASVD